MLESFKLSVAKRLPSNFHSTELTVEEYCPLYIKTVSYYLKTFSIGVSVYTYCFNWVGGIIRRGFMLQIRAPLSQPTANWPSQSGRQAIDVTPRCRRSFKIDSELPKYTRTMSSHVATAIRKYLGSHAIKRIVCGVGGCLVCPRDPGV